MHEYNIDLCEKGAKSSPFHLKMTIRSILCIWSHFNCVPPPPPRRDPHSHSLEYISVQRFNGIHHHTGYWYFAKESPCLNRRTVMAQFLRKWTLTFRTIPKRANIKKNYLRWKNRKKIVKRNKKQLNQISIWKSKHAEVTYGSKEPPCQILT